MIKYVYTTGRYEYFHTAVNYEGGSVRFHEENKEIQANSDRSGKNHKGDEWLSLGGWETKFRRMGEKVRGIGD
jgi:hypothetical protein